MTDFLLDSHILFWWINGESALPKRLRGILEKAKAAGNALLISDISLLEIATFVRLRRLHLDVPLRDWLELASAPPLIERVGISPEIAAESTSLPRTFPKDPADRVIVATARVMRARLVTCDQSIIKSGVVAVA